MSNHQWIRRCNYMGTTLASREFFECTHCHQGRLGQELGPKSGETWLGAYRVWDGSPVCPGVAAQQEFFGPPWVLTHMWVGEGGPHTHCQSCRQRATPELRAAPCAGTCICQNCGEPIDVHQGGRGVTFRLSGPGPCPDGGEFVFCKTPRRDLEKGWVR